MNVNRVTPPALLLALITLSGCAGRGLGERESAELTRSARRVPGGTSIPAEMGRLTCECGQGQQGQRVLGGEAVPIWVSSYAVPSGETVTLRIEFAGPSPKSDDLPVSFFMANDANDDPKAYIEDTDKAIVKIVKDRSWAELTLITKAFPAGTKGKARTVHVVVPNKQYTSYAVGTLVITADDVPKR